MAFRKFLPDALFTGHGMAPAGTVLVTDGTGRVEALLSAEEAGGDVQRLQGTLTPGFVNAHCHLELSHLRGCIPPGTGLLRFLGEVVGLRESPAEQIREAMLRAEQEMWQEGIVAVGDICNREDSLPVKRSGRLLWTNFVEVVALSEALAAERVARARELLRRFEEAGLEPESREPRASLVPHAPYSLHPAALDAIDAASRGRVISIHSQETAAEDELSRQGTGPFLDFFGRWGIRESPLPVTGRTGTVSVLERLHGRQSVLLVHNTYMGQADLEATEQTASERGLELHFCLCPQANLYIEGRLPDVGMLATQGARSIVIGTDGLSSNYRLSITEELRAIRERFPGIGMERLLGWATLNGARALRREDVLGSFEAGKRPGVVLIDAGFSASRIL